MACKNETRKESNDTISTKPLPRWVQALAFIAIIAVGLPTVWYGINAGVINQEITLYNKGSIFTATGFLAVVAGLAVASMGCCLLWFAFYILKKKQ